MTEIAFYAKLAGRFLGSKPKSRELLPQNLVQTCNSLTGHGMENGMERKFRYGIWKVPEWNGIFQEWNGRQSSILPYQFHTRFRALYLQKNTYQCRVVINNIDK